MNTSLTIVLSPLQYLCAIECISSKDYNILIVFNCYQLKQILFRLNHEKKWDKVYYLDFSGSLKNLFLHRRVFKDLKNELSQLSIKSIVRSAYFCYSANAICNWFPEIQVKYVDDGTETLFLLDFYRKEHAILPSLTDPFPDRDYYYFPLIKIPKLQLPFFIKKYILYTFGFNISLPKHSELITFFNLNKLDPDLSAFFNKISHQSFRSLKSNINHKKDDVLFFIKSEFISSSFMSKDYAKKVGLLDYINFDIKMLGEIHTHCKKINKTLKVCIHRADKSKKACLEFCKNNDIEVVNNDIPIELYFIENQICPTHIISDGPTTALVTMNILFNAKPYIFLEKRLKNEKTYMLFLNKTLDQIKQFDQSNIHIISF